MIGFDLKNFSYCYNTTFKLLKKKKNLEKYLPNFRIFSCPLNFVVTKITRNYCPLNIVVTKITRNYVAVRDPRFPLL